MTASLKSTFDDDSTVVPIRRLDVSPPEPTPRRTRNRWLSQSRIVEAAAVLLTRAGYDAFSMRSLAEVLGVEAAALYWHVKSRQALGGLVLDHLMEDVPEGSPGGDWQADLRALAIDLRVQLLGRRDLTRLFCEAHGASAKGARREELAVRALRTTGLSAEDAACVHAATLAFVVGWLQSAPVMSSGASGPSATAAFAAAFDLLVGGLSGRAANDEPLSLEAPR